MLYKNKFIAIFAVTNFDKIHYKNKKIIDYYLINSDRDNITYNEKNQDKYETEKILKINSLKYLFDNQNIGEDSFFLLDIDSNTNVIIILYYLAYMFEKVVIYDGNKIKCYNFKPIITKQDIQEDKYPVKKLTELINYLEYMLKYNIQKYKLIIDNDEDKFLELIISEAFATFTYYDKITANNAMIEFTKSIINKFKRVYIKNKIIKISSAISEEEGKYILNIIDKYKFTQCLEIGMAFGISALYILSNLQTKLISVDPFQSSQWNNKGLQLLQEFSFNKRHILYEMKNYVALPKILEKFKEDSFEFIFIDGFHTFDYTLIDFFYSNLILKIGGIIIIDDALHSGVQKCIAYITTNYKDFYRKLESPKSFAVFQKKKQDTREWNFHNNF